MAGEQVTLRPVGVADHAVLRRIFADPGVRRWWGSTTFDVESHEDEAGTVHLAVVVADQVVGMIQFYEESDPQYRHAGIDVAIADAHQRQGFGTEAISLVLDHLTDLGHHRVIIDPNATNTNAIKTYRRLGFTEVGVMRQYEWSDHEQAWTDGLLMELLLTDRPT